MKKIICAISAVIVVALLSISSFAINITSYEEAPGGEVRSAEELITALGGDKNAEITKSGIALKENIVLKASIVIKNGSYTLIGRGCGIYRGFEREALIKLESGAKLTLSKSSSAAYGNGSPELTVSGRSDEISNGGPLVSLSGGSELTVNSNVLFENTSSSAYGGAIYASGGSNVTLINCGFSNCTSSLGGGAVAFVSDKIGSEYGTLNVSGASFTDNTATNTAANANGGAIYVSGGTFEINSCVFENNTADMGGAIWACSNGKISACEAENNKANVSGGVLYVASNGESAVGSVSVENGMFMNNLSDGNGGFASNFGAMIVGGSYVSDNTAASDGGAVYNEGSFMLTEGTLLSNICGKRGGGVCNIGVGSVFVMNGGEINSNKGRFGAGVFCQGSFSMNGGAVGNSLSDEAGVVVYQDMTLSSSAIIGDTIALCINGEIRPKIKITGELTSKSGFEVICVKEKTDKNGELSRYTVKNTLGSTVITGDTKNNADKFSVVTSFLKCGVKGDGTIGMQFPFFPVWVWICVLAVLLAAAGAVFYFKVGKSLIARRKEKPNE